MATDTDAQAYIDAVELAASSTYSTTYDSAIDQLVLDLKSAGIWSKLDRFGVFINQFQEGAKIDLKDPTVTYTEQGGVSWAERAGYTGNGTDALVDMDFIPSTDGVNFLQDSATWGIKFPTGTTSLTGSHGIGTAQTNIRGGVSVALNGSESALPTASFSLVLGSRSSSTNVSISIDGGTFNNPSSTSTAPSGSFSIAVLAENRFGGRNWSSDTVEFALLGGALIEAEVADLWTAMNDYITNSESTGLIIAAEQGSYSITGQEANIILNRILTAESGSYEITGATSELLENFIIQAEQGSYSITGQDVNILLNYYLQAVQGTYSITGQEANILLNRIITAESGSYEITGATSQLLKNFIMQADQGSYSVTGFDASITLLLVTKIVLESGNYSITGNDVDLIRNLILRAEQGDYNITGQEARLLQRMLLSVESGSYEITGQEVEFITQDSPEVLELVSKIKTILSLNSKV